MDSINKVALITGSTRGIGEGIAYRLAHENYKIVVTGLEEDLGRKVVQKIKSEGGQAIFIYADLRDPKACTSLIQTTYNALGRLDVLINNAAIFPSVKFENLEPQTWDDVFEINVRAALLCSQIAISVMRKQGRGSIINIGSTLAYCYTIERLAYACSKAALLTMTRGLAAELLKDHITVNWISVGWVATPGEISLRNQLYGDGEEKLRLAAKNTPMGRLETVEEIAAGVSYLLSDEASHITGCELNISGGRFI